MAYTTINKGSDYFNTVLYTGNGGTNNITGVEFQPDLVWIKNRNSTNEHCVTDVVRGATKYLHTNLTQAETTAANSLTSFDSDGFSLGNNANFNTNTNTYVAWNWLADNTSGSSNTDGSITSTVSSNTTSGFSIVTYTGTGVSETIGHGLGAVPNVIIVKGSSGTSAVDGWYTYHSSVGNTKFVELNNTGGATTFSTMWDNTTPTTTTFSTTYLSKASTNYVAYFFAEKKGFSKFGGYTGNGSTDGTFVYTGFKPAFVMTKESATTGSWNIFDNRRENPFNVVKGNLKAESSIAEESNTNLQMDFVSNAFKLRGTGGDLNGSGTAMIYMAFAENPFVTSTGIPTTVR